MAPQNTYKVRKFQNGKRKDGTPFMNYSLTIPSHIAEALPSDKQFECVLTDDGILFRPVEGTGQEVELPSWAQPTNGQPKSEGKTRKRPQRKSS